MKEHTKRTPAATIGIDIGEKTSHVAVIDCAGEWVESATMPTTTAAFSRAFANYEGARVVLEVGTHSPWISRILKERGSEVIVANPRRVRLIAAADRKNDDIDAEVLSCHVKGRTLWNTSRQKATPMIGSTMLMPLLRNSRSLASWVAPQMFESVE